MKTLIHILCIFMLSVTAHANPPINEGIGNIQFDGIVLEKLTPAFIQNVKATKPDKLAYLSHLEQLYHIPDTTLQVKWMIESVAGTKNIKNKSGYEGHFQFGEYEQKLCNLKDPYDFEQAANATVCLLRDYHVKFQTYVKQPVLWETRNMTDMYMTHQQGFRGAAEQYNTLVFNDALSPRIKANMCHNIAKQYKPLLFKKNTCVLNPGISDHDYALFFYRMWEAEMRRIYIELKK